MHADPDKTKRPFPLRYASLSFLIAGIGLFLNGYILNMAVSHSLTGGLTAAATDLIAILCVIFSRGVWNYNDTARKGIIVLNYIVTARHLIQLAPLLTQTFDIASPALTTTVVLIASIRIGLAIAIDRYLRSDQILELFEINDRRKNQNWRQHNR